MKRHFRFKCNPVLPTVYDDALSYYEVLCKLQQNINELALEIDEGLIDFIKEALPELISEATYDDATGTLEFVLVDDDVDEDIRTEPIKRISINGISRPVMDEIARAWFNESWLYGKNICMYGDSTLVVPETYATKIQSSGICNNVTIRGISGQNLTVQGYALIQEATDLGNFDYVFVCYGINDWAGLPKYQWEQAVKNTAQRIINAGSEPVFVFPWKVYINTMHSNGFINDYGCDMASYVDSAIDMCEQLNVKYFNLCQLSGVNESNYTVKLTRSDNGYYLHESNELGELIEKIILNGNYNTGKCYGDRFKNQFRVFLPTNWGYANYDTTKQLIQGSTLEARRGKALTVTYTRICEFSPVSCGEYVKVKGYVIHPISTGYVDFYFIDLYNSSAGAQHICRAKNGADFEFVFHPSYLGDAFKLCAQSSDSRDAVIMDLSISGSDGNGRLTTDTPSVPCLSVDFEDNVELVSGGYIDTFGDDGVMLKPFSVRMLTTVASGQTVTIGNVGFYPQHTVYGTAHNGSNVFVYRVQPTGEIQIYAPPANVANTTYVFFGGCDITPSQFLY